jgi:superfamily I DNA and/or RNA helicase
VIQATSPSSTHALQMLDTQYRMHPLICGFISRTFYGGALSDAPGMAEKTAAPWHASPCFGPLAFFDVRGTTRCLVLHLFFPRLARLPATGRLDWHALVPLMTCGGGLTDATCCSFLA